MPRDDANETLTDLIRFGTIQSVGGDRAVVRCGDVASPPLPWFSFAGLWSLWLPPSQDEQVMVVCPDGDIAGGVIVAGIFSTAFPGALLGAQIAQLKAPDAATFRYDAAAHALTFTLPSSGTVKIIAPGGFEFEGDTKVTGKLEVTDDATFGAKVTATGEIKSNDDVKAVAISLKNHKHGGVQAGAVKTAVPE